MLLEWLSLRDERELLAAFLEADLAEAEADLCALADEDEWCLTEVVLALCLVEAEAETEAETALRLEADAAETADACAAKI